MKDTYFDSRFWAGVTAGAIIGGFFFASMTVMALVGAGTC